PSSISLYRIFFFNDPPTTEIYTLSLHDALPIFLEVDHEAVPVRDRRHRAFRDGFFEQLADVGRHEFDLQRAAVETRDVEQCVDEDRKSTRLNSSHVAISYAVFCLKKKTIYISR